MKQGRVMRNIEGTIRAIDRGDGICELIKDIDVLTIIPERKKHSMKLITLGTLALFIAAAVTMIMIAPAFGVLLFALVAWTMFAALATGEGDDE